MLSKEKEAFFEELLTQNLSALRAQLHNTINDSSQSDDRPIEFVDLASFESNSGFSLRIIERQNLLIGKISLALEKIRAGEFGICEECGQEISEARLLARPVAALCIDCKRSQERAEKARA